MDLLFLKGAALGFSMAAPIGPVGLLLVRTTLKRGHLAGFIMAMAIATGDALYGAVAAFGLTFISDPLITYKAHIQFFGGLILLVIAYRILTTNHKVTAAKLDQKKNATLLQVYISTMILTLSNPTTLFSFAAVFAAFNMTGSEVDLANSSLIVLGVFLGSGGWFALLNWVTAKFRNAVTEARMLKINKLAAIMLALFALFAVAQGARSLF